MEKHLQFIKVICIVGSALTLLSSTFGLVYLNFFMPESVSAPVSQNQIFIDMMPIYYTMYLYSLIVCIVGLIAGVGLHKGKAWARNTLFAVAVLILISFPLGTIFGIYLFWVLFQQETKELFGASQIQNTKS